jgi:CBS domain-containing protein
MIARDLVTDIIPLASVADSVADVLGWMDLYRVTHLPIGDSSGYLGLISESDLLGLPDQTRKLESCLPHLEMIYASEQPHVFEVIEEFASHRLTLLPVLSESKQYIGSITLAELVQKFSLLTSSGQPGAILVLTMAARDYSLASLSRIIEENNARILSLFVSPAPESTEIQVTIKINTTEVIAITRSLERFGYVVRSYFLDNETIDDFYRTRYEELMNYMNF